MDITNNTPANIDAEFGRIDFMNASNFEQFIELIRGDQNADPIINFCPKFDCRQTTGCFHENQFVMPPIQENVFDFDVVDIVDPNFGLNTQLPHGENMKVVGEEENDEGDSTTTTTTTTTTQNRAKKADRSKTLISERRRRSRMKEKLYALRALVPNITKMDKASIIGDAVLYMQELQMQAKKLKAEIADLESSLAETNRCHDRSFQNANKINFMYNHPVTKKILQINVSQVEERGFYVSLVCQKGFGVAMSLYKALESFYGFDVQSTNLATAAEDYVLTFTLHDRSESKVEMNLPNLKLWIATAFLSQGFDFETALSA